MILILQTNIDHMAAVWLVSHGKIIGYKSETTIYPKRPTPVLLIDAVLKKAKKKPSAIQKIIISRGPGRFSAVRSSIIIGNLLATELNIPIAGFVRTTMLQDEDVLVLAQKYQDIHSLKPIRPWYGKRPNITISKKKFRKLQRSH